MNSKTILRAKEIAMALFPKNKEHSHRCFHVAFLVKKNKILHIGINSNKSHPRILDYEYKKYAGTKTHAELSAVLRSGREDLSDFELISVRINLRGNFAMAKPCSGCQSLLEQVGIKRVYYTNVAGVLESY
jgi:deoxycytidylate deaminase